MPVSCLILAGLALWGCAQRHEDRPDEPRLRPPAEVVVVAPVLNLSGRSDWDALKVTDWLASELQTFPHAAVVPVNRALAALRVAGLERVETPADAQALARALGADATLVAAVTEFDPYEPLRIGWIMQWYVADTVPQGAALAAEGAAAGPEMQFQRVFSAADERVLEEVKEYADRHEGHASPYEWRVYVKRQEWFIRYSCWSSIRSMLERRSQYRTAGPVHSAEAGW